MFRIAIVAFLIAAPAIAQKPYDLKTEDGAVVFTIGDDGVPMVDFVKWAQEVTGRVFTYDKKALAAAEPIKQIGALRMSRADFQQEFFQFFQTRMFIAGFALQKDDDTGVTTIVALPKRPVAVRFVPVTDLDEYKTGTEQILTSIQLATVTPQVAIERVSKVAGATVKEVALKAINGSLLVQGAGADVYCVWRMVRLLDGVHPTAVEVVALEHAVAADLVVGLRQLIAEHHPAVVVVAHGAANALMISGAPAVVEELKDVIGLLDRPAKK